MSFDRCCFPHTARPQIKQNKCYMIVLRTPALFILVITSGIEFVPENSPIVKFDPNRVSNGQFSSPETTRRMGTSFQRNDFWDSFFFWGGGGQALLMINGCLEYHRPIITNACPSRRSRNHSTQWLYQFFLDFRKWKISLS